MTNTDPRREAVRHVDQQIELCSRSYASARVARDPEGMELIRSRYLDLEIKNREAEADYLAPKHGNPTPYRQAVGDCGVANMTTAIEYDLEAIREAEMYDHEPRARFAVRGQMLTGITEEFTLCVTETAAEAFEALAAEWEREDGFDIIRVVEISTGREIKPPRTVKIERGQYQGQSVLWATAS